jgi:hypothetical protein
MTTNLLVTYNVSNTFREESNAGGKKRAYFEYSCSAAARRCSSEQDFENAYNAIKNDRVDGKLTIRVAGVLNDAEFDTTFTKNPETDVPALDQFRSFLESNNLIKPGLAITASPRM